MNYEDILIKPVVSEKASALREQNKYVFVVHPDATKTQIKESLRHRRYGGGWWRCCFRS